MNNKRFENRFVQYIPKEIENGVLYVSMENSICIHLCACGCNEKVITRLSPKDWNLLYNGKDLTMNPSIGNWNFKCRSHYWIRKNTFVFIFEDSKKKQKKSKTNWFKFW